MEIEYEEKVKEELPVDKEADGEKPIRKRRKKREWEEAVEIIMPDELNVQNETLATSPKETQKKKKSKKHTMEIEEKIESLQETINKMKTAQDEDNILRETIKEGNNYSDELEKSKQTIMNLNFQNVIARLDQTVQTRVPDQGSFVSFVELLVDKPHLDLLENFNEQLIEHLQLNTQTSVVRYLGIAQPFKMFTSLRESIELALSSDRVAEIKRLQKNSSEDTSVKKEKLVIVCVLGEKAYNMKKTTMCELAKFLKEEYEDREYTETSLAIIIPVSNLQRVADIPVFSIELCKPKDMFARFLLNIFKNSSLPILSPELLQCLLAEFDLYSISFGEQVRRVRLAITDCLFRSTQQQNKHHGDSSLKRREASAVVNFLEKLYGTAQKLETFSQANIDATHRIIEIVLSKSPKYIMPLSQKEEFLRDIQENCKNVASYLEEAQKDDNLFSRYIAVFKNIDVELKNDLDKKKSLANGANLSRYDKLKKKQAEKDLDPTALGNLKIEKIEEIIREIIQYSLHRNIRPNSTTHPAPWLLECKLDQYSKVIRPDFVGSLLARFTDAEQQTQTKDQLDVMDGMILLSQCVENERDIDISSALKKYKSYLQESGDKRGDQWVYQSSFYNAVCELRYKGILEEKRALKNQFFKHFYAKTSFFSAR